MLFSRCGNDSSASKSGGDDALGGFKRIALVGAMDSDRCAPCCGHRRPSLPHRVDWAPEPFCMVSRRSHRNTWATHHCTGAHESAKSCVCVARERMLLFVQLPNRLQHAHFSNPHSFTRMSGNKFGRTRILDTVRWMATCQHKRFQGTVDTSFIANMVWT